MRRAPTHRWRGGRVAEGGGLLNRYTVNPVSWVRIPSPPPPRRIYSFIYNYLPESVVEAFAGVGNPFSLGTLKPGERVVDLGAGGGLGECRARDLFQVAR